MVSNSSTVGFDRIHWTLDSNRKIKKKIMESKIARFPRIFLSSKLF